MVPSLTLYDLPSPQIGVLMQRGHLSGFHQITSVLAISGICITIGGYTFIAVRVYLAIIHFVQKKHPLTLTSYEISIHR